MNVAMKFISILIVLLSVASCASSSRSTLPPADRGQLIKETQQMLLSSGYNPGPADGLMGKRTRAAIKAFQKANNIPITGKVSADLHRQLSRNSTRKASAETKNSTSEERKAAKRRKLSKNASIVRMHRSCKGVFIPEVKRTLFRGVVPVYNAYIINNSNKRYRMKFDYTYRIQGKNYFGRIDETLTKEKTTTLRPGKFIELPLETGNQSGNKITGISELIVLGCDST